MEDPAQVAMMQEINLQAAFTHLPACSVSHSGEMQDMIRTYNGLTDRCFNLCANNFARKNLDQMV